MYTAETNPNDLYSFNTKSKTSLYSEDQTHEQIANPWDTHRNKVDAYKMKWKRIKNGNRKR